MKVLSHTLGFPRIGPYRELKKAQEKYWNNQITKKKLFDIGYNIRKFNLNEQKVNNIDLLPIGDFAWYDHVLNISLMLGNVPIRFKEEINNIINIDTMFYIARGSLHDKKSLNASKMTKWFNTNYHYIVPEFYKNQSFHFSSKELLNELDEAIKMNFNNIKPILIGPITYLWLGNKIQNNHFSRLELLTNILSVYIEILLEIKKRNIQWVQIDEPILALELPKKWLQAFKNAYDILRDNINNINILLTTYFGSISHNIELIKMLPVHGIHIDLVNGKDNIEYINNNISKKWIISFGIISGRNIWKTNLKKWYDILLSIKKSRPLLWIGSSCSLIHSPVDLNLEFKLNKKIKNWFSFSIQKCKELSLITKAINNNDYSELVQWSESIYSRKFFKDITNIKVQKKILLIGNHIINNRKNYNTRSLLQKRKLKLPFIPTTTIGSFPQTSDVRKLRSDFKSGFISYDNYKKNMKKHIKNIINIQENLDLDVLVHGEPERNDMVEYFGENLNGFVITENGWVQSYGSRCVKPPIIIGDISRKKPITVYWSKYAQSLTKKIVKGMLTGPITMLLWSFPRDDISPIEITKQIALALKEEIYDLEKANIKIIQIDEPALREGLPLKKSEWNSYLKWAKESFHLTISSTKDVTQIHTHMCYSEFKDIIHDIIALDADVISIETSRSGDNLIKLFKNLNYPNELGLGVYDIHSPNIPSINKIKKFLIKALKNISFKNFWVNPDCGLKTRTWEEVKQSLYNMVKATKILRKKYNNF
ncbi:5-methyltetrahydropteroyltriglutamate--homocysteine S-methyltransferase [Enterobacteriaceae endosymbiont of Plateumaris consimilis]|uniref:5-methyltetrahydropteroyltriglutamate-- homocysteine S-methyltransferase n=1 Tax=Enterobacteriaceae endosymbiont of Plateumaris consimilis TaxID=2675794 RepID=UPI00144A147A|nr:5-methyltetrahydropteroyltriglutamate--homocysteine S-methyltransferase [Enterobacteriaceae endosymbiont of Plateumaris consimilis]QJC28455.1 5-methyltetrahydropteroyltriglutamate--homocysteine S-methyltransferase [Enterobacteriaceae endosymbiont of Plateumaris consimilis]